MTGVSPRTNSPQKEGAPCLPRQVAPSSLRKVLYLSPASKTSPPCLWLWTVSSTSVHVTFPTHKTTPVSQGTSVEQPSASHGEWKRLQRGTSCGKFTGWDGHPA